MPDNQLDSILQKAGILDSPPKNLAKLSSINDQMDDAGLTNEYLFGSIANILAGDGSEHTKLRAIEAALKAKQIGSPSVSSDRQQMIQIIINDPGAPAVKVNPILLPREILDLQ